MTSVPKEIGGCPSQIGGYYGWEGVWEGGEMGKRGQKIHISSSKINKSWGCNIRDYS